MTENNIYTHPIWTSTENSYIEFIFDKTTYIIKIRLTVDDSKYRINIYARGCYTPYKIFDDKQSTIDFLETLIGHTGYLVDVIYNSATDTLENLSSSSSSKISSDEEDKSPRVSFFEKIRLNLIKIKINLSPLSSPRYNMIFNTSPRSPRSPQFTSLQKLKTRSSPRSKSCDSSPRKNNK